ncbi:hypothetical protein [Aquabacterium sp.]|uniref:hypothetical protein n=1 Tax=Aquabacterium sp. TaxID=1872578 RepID=UPI0035AF7B95
MLKRRLDLWLPTYALETPARLAGKLARRNRLTHLIFLVCDHYEPRHQAKRTDQPAERVSTWHREYAAMQRRCEARFGTTPLHTFFYPPHHGSEHLPALAQMVFDGLGEVELHYHHHGDTAETLRRNLGASLADYRSWGLLQESGEQPTQRFGFIHGDWALDNSCHGRYCGVNGELSILEEFGCWGDLTMPSANEAQTRKINSIYYAVDNPARSKSHDWGEDAAVGRRPDGFFLMQGPLGINWRAPGYPRIENASLTTENWGRADRIRKWIDCQVHVKGRPEWLFIKLHTHGAVERDFDGLFGERAFEMHRLLNEHYNDGQRFKLHYVTARQACNIAKAAEDGKAGDPSQWLDYRIAKPAHAFYVLDAPHRLERCTAQHLTLTGITAASGQDAQLRTRIGPIHSVSGPLRSLDLDARQGLLTLEAPEPGSNVTLTVVPHFELLGVEGGNLTAAPPADGDMQTLRFTAGPRTVIRFQRAGQPDSSSPGAQPAAPLTQPRAHA